MTRTKPQIGWRSAAGNRSVFPFADWHDTDYQVGAYGQYTDVFDEMDTVNVRWVVYGAGTVDPEMGPETTLTAGEAEQDSDIAVQSQVTDLGSPGPGSLDGSWYEFVNFAAKVPTGITPILIDDYPKVNWQHAPPANWLGAQSRFRLCVMPNNVGFGNLTFQEMISTNDQTMVDQTFNWPNPNAAQYTVTAKRKPFGTLQRTIVNGQKYRSTVLDTVGVGLFGVEVLNNGGYQGCQHDVLVFLRHTTGGGNWRTFANTIHPKVFTGGASLTTKVGVDNVFGGQQGPWRD